MVSSSDCGQTPHDIGLGRGVARVLVSVGVVGFMCLILAYVLRSYEHFVERESRERHEDIRQLVSEMKSGRDQESQQRDRSLQATLTAVSVIQAQQVSLDQAVKALQRLVKELTETKKGTGCQDGNGIDCFGGCAGAATGPRLRDEPAREPVWSACGCVAPCECGPPDCCCQCPCAVFSRRQGNLERFGNGCGGRSNTARGAGHHEQARCPLAWAEYHGHLSYPAFRAWQMGRSGLRR